MERRFRKVLAEYYVFLVLILFWLVASVALPESFFTPFNFATILIVCAPLALVCLGQNYVILTGGFDLSIGAMVSLATAVAADFMSMNTVEAIILVLAVGLAIGAFNGLGVTKLGIDPFIMTLGTMGLAAGLALYLRPYPGGYICSTFRGTILYDVTLFNVDFPLGPFLILAITAVVGELILQRRNFGRMIYAIGGNEENARIAGINTHRVKTLVYAISGLTASIAGLYVAAWMNAGDALVGDPYLFDSIIAVSLGGTPVTGGRGRYRNTIGGALILATMDRFCNQLGINIWYTWIVKGMLIVVIVALRIMK